VTAPRLEIDLGAIGGNARALVDRLAPLGIGVTGVTKATLGSVEVAQELLAAGVSAIGESRIESVEALRRGGIVAPVVLLRSPTPSQADRVVAGAEVSLNTELDVVAALSAAAVTQRRTHAVVLMVELGDLREGILPADLVGIARAVLRLPGTALRGIGANLACQSGTVPDGRNMAELTGLARSVESDLGIHLDVVSGGGSANLGWALGPSPDVGRIDDLRLGEAILLGCDPLRRRPIEGLRTDAITLVAEVIESKVKPSLPWGDTAESAFGPPPTPVDRGHAWRAVVALGRQDVDPDDVVAPEGMAVLGASSDHLVLDAGDRPPAVGAEVRFGLGYSALLRAMTSPFVARTYTSAPPVRGGGSGALPQM
jgi:predicted amino acid racemase